MEELSRSEVLKSVRFTNRFYHLQGKTIYSFAEDIVYMSNDLEILRYHYMNCVKVASIDERDYFAELNDYLKYGDNCKRVFSAKVEDLCYLSDTSYGWLKS